MITVGSKIVTLIPVTDTNAYATGDQIGLGATELTDATRTPGNYITIESLVVVDKAKQKAKIDILFFSSPPTLSNLNNAAPDMTDTEMANKYLGRVSILDTDYADLANQSEASKFGIGLMVCNKREFAGSKETKSIYAIVVSRGTPTYTGVTDLVIKIGIYQH